LIGTAACGRNGESPVFFGKAEATLRTPAPGGRKSDTLLAGVRLTNGRWFLVPCREV